MEKVTRRRLEGRWRRTRLIVDRELYKWRCAFVCKLIREVKGRYHSEPIAELSSDPRELFRPLQTLLEVDQKGSIHPALFLNNCQTDLLIILNRR